MWERKVNILRRTAILRYSPYHPEDADMVKISSVEFQKNFGRYQDAALTEPVTVTRNGRDRVVMISVEEYQRLKRRDRQVMSLADFTDADIAAIKASKPPAEVAQFDDEIE